MKNKNIVDAIGMVDDKMLLDAQPNGNKPQSRHVKSSVMKWVSLAACVCLVAGIGIFALVSKNDSVNTSDVDASSANGATKPSVTDTNTNSSKFEDKIIYFDSSDEQEAIDRLPKWDEMTIEDKYSDLKLDTVIESEKCGKMDMSHIYITNSHELDIADLGEKIGTASVKGYDHYEETEHTMYVAVYEIKTIAPHCAVAAELSKGKYYVYINHSYKPQTLGEFIDDLSLRENISFGGAGLGYFDENMQHNQIVFEDSINVEGVWGIVMNDRSIEAMKDYDAHRFEDEIIGLSVSIEKLGYKNISMQVTEDGYLTTNILATGKAFYIGTDACYALRDYVVDNYKGYRLVYVDTNDDAQNLSDDSQCSSSVSSSDDSATVSTVISQGKEPMPE